jgi:hypothetical protein
MKFGIERRDAMQIDEYVTGSHIRIGGKTYHRDLKIIAGEVKRDWWRAQGHRLDRADIEDILSVRPRTLVIGTGYAGAMRVPAATLTAISELGIHVIAERTARAVQTFNRLEAADAAIAGAFHLTC